MCQLDRQQLREYRDELQSLIEQEDTNQLVREAMRFDQWQYEHSARCAECAASMEKVIA